MADDPVPVNLFSTLGSGGFVRYGRRVYEEWHNELQGYQGVRVYREMQDNSAAIGSALKLTKDILKQVIWKAKPAAGSPRAVDEAKFLDDAVAGMDTPWADLISDILSMIPFGWAFCETTMKALEDGRVTWREIALRAQETLDDWIFDEDGSVTGTRGKPIALIQWAYPDSQRVTIPLVKGILFRAENNKGSPEGRSFLRNCYRSWFFLKRLEEIEAIGIERDLVGLPVVYLPTSYLETNAPPDKAGVAATMFSLVQQIRRNEREGVLFPHPTLPDGRPSGFDLKLLAGGGSRQFDVGTTIQRHQRDIAMNFGTQFQMLGSAGSTGSWALSSDQTDLFGMALGAILKNIRDTFNRQGVQPLFKINGVPRELWPTYEPGDVEKQDIVRFAQAMASLTAAGAIVHGKETTKHTHEVMGLPPPEEGGEAVPMGPEPGAEVEGEVVRPEGAGAGMAGEGGRDGPGT